MLRMILYTTSCLLGALFSVVVHAAWPDAPAPGPQELSIDEEQGIMDFTRTSSTDSRNISIALAPSRDTVFDVHVLINTSLIQGEGDGGAHVKAGLWVEGEETHRAGFDDRIAGLANGKWWERNYLKTGPIRVAGGETARVILNVESTTIPPERAGSDWHARFTAHEAVIHRSYDAERALLPFIGLGAVVGGALGGVVHVARRGMSPSDPR